MSGYVYIDGIGEHVLVAERALGRSLPHGAVVHHVDGTRDNNEPRNLVVCPNQSYHLLLHARQRVQDAGGHPDQHRVCSRCRVLLCKDAFSTDGSEWDGRNAKCRACVNTYRRERGYNHKPFGWKERMQQQTSRAIGKEAACPLPC